MRCSRDSRRSLQRCDPHRAVSSGPGTRSARGNAERRSARSRHSGAGCSQAPRPGSRRRGSGVSTPCTTTTRNRPSADALVRHPTQVRTGPDGWSLVRGGGRTCRSRARVEGRCRSVAAAPARVLRTGGARRSGVDRRSGPRPTPAPRRPRRAPRGSASLRMSMRHPVSRAASRAFCPSLPMASESWKSGTTTRAVLVRASSTRDRHHLRRRQGVADERGGVVRPVDDVDLLAGQLAHHAAHPGPDRADARALRVHPGHRGPDRDLGPVPGLAGDRDDLHRPVDDLRVPRARTACAPGWDASGST